MRPWLRQGLGLMGVVLAGSVAFSAVLWGFDELPDDLLRDLAINSVPFLLLIPLAGAARLLELGLRRFGDSLPGVLCGSGLVFLLPFSFVYFGLLWFLWAWWFMPPDFRSAL